MKPVMYETKIVNAETKGVGIAQVSRGESLDMQTNQNAERFYANVVFSPAYFGDQMTTIEQANASLAQGLRALADKIESGE